MATVQHDLERWRAQSCERASPCRSNVGSESFRAKQGDPTLLHEGAENPQLCELRARLRVNHLMAGSHGPNPDVRPSESSLGPRLSNRQDGQRAVLAVGDVGGVIHEVE